MITVQNLTKHLGDKLVLDNINITFERGTIYGIIGTNGAGKSTLLRHLSGVYKQDSGVLTLDDDIIYDNPVTKKQVAFLSDDPYFIENATINKLKAYYKNIYSTFNDEIFNELLELFKLQPDKRVSTFSKGMKKQVNLLIALSCSPNYLLLDETFDGIDPLIRIHIKKFIVNMVAENNMCVIISSHNINDLENLCDSIILLDNNTIMFNRSVSDLSSHIHKIQVYSNEPIIPALDVLKHEKFGLTDMYIVRGEYDLILQAFNKFNVSMLNIVPLTLEEIFIYEMEAKNE